MAKQKKRMSKRRVRPVPLDCSFCKQKTEPDYKEIDILKRFISDRGKIVGRSKTGICQKHQRAVSQSIKRARFMAFLPFIVRPS